MPHRVEHPKPDGVDYGRVMQATVVATILGGVPLIAGLAVFVSLPTWTARAVFALRVGDVVWIVTVLGVFWYAGRVSRTRGDQ